MSSTITSLFTLVPVGSTVGSFDLSFVYRTDTNGALKVLSRENKERETHNKAVAEGIASGTIVEGSPESQLRSILEIREFSLSYNRTVDPAELVKKPAPAPDMTPLEKAEAKAQAALKSLERARAKAAEAAAQASNPQ